MGVATTMAIIGTAAAVKSARDQKKAQQSAANEQRQAQIQSANVLAEAGRKAEADILRQNAQAEYTSQLAAIEAEKPLKAFADVGAYKQAIENELNNLPVGGAIADSIRGSVDQFIASRPEFQSEFLQDQAGRQGDLSVSAASPQFRDSMAQAGQQGLAAATDIARIRQASKNRLADLVGGTASQRAGVLVGQAPTLTNLSQGATEARILGEVAGQRFNTAATEQVAGLAGQLFSPKSGLLRRDEFGFRKGEDPFAG